MLAEEAHISNFRRISDETAKDSGNNAEKLGPRVIRYAFYKSQEVKYEFED